MTSNLEKKNLAASDETDQSYETETKAQMLCAIRPEHPVICIPRTSNKIIMEKIFKVAYPLKVTNSSTWRTGDIPHISYEYRRPRTAFEVNDADILTIAHRIFESNKIRSIHAVYAGAISTCKTSSYMKFTIRLLRLSESTDTTLVDVRRRTGCSLAFRDEYRAIFSAAVHGDIIPRKVPRSMAIPFTDVECMQGKNIPLEEGSIERSLNASMNYLDSKMYDTRLLTLQDLLSTTDPSSIETSPEASKLIVTEYHKIFEYIVDDIMKQVEYGDLDDDDSEEYLRSLTLNILGNILSSVPDNKTPILLINQKQYTISIIQSLAWYVSKAHMCPWNSCLAAKCLRLLASTSSEVRSQIGTEANMLLKNAEEFGKCSYELLEKEANAALLVTSV